MSPAGNMRMGRKRNMKKSRWKCKLTGFLMLVLAFAAGIYMLSQQSFFPLKEVVFYGNKHMSSGDMKTLMGLRGSEDMLYLKGRPLAEKLLRSPWIKTASLRKEYPHRLLVRVQEAEPFALFRTSGRIFIIDEAGRKLEELREERPVQLLPVISSDAPVNPAVFSEALAFVRAVRDANIPDKQVEITGVSAGKEDLTALIDGTVIKVGEGRYAEKIEKFLELEAEIKRRWADIDYIDLRFTNRVVVKPVKEVLR